MNDKIDQGRRAKFSTRVANRALTRIHRLPVPLPKRLSNPLFDADWYLNRYPDVRESGMNAFLHYRRYGIGEGRDPSPSFDTRWYLDQNPDVANAGLDPLDHYLCFGIAEGRLSKPPCSECGLLEVTRVIHDAETGDLRRLCEACFAEQAAIARRMIVADLLDEHPNPGSRALYQPVALDELKDWRLDRPDSELRATIGWKAAMEFESMARPSEAPASFLDVGSHTGFFCEFFANRGIPGHRRRLEPSLCSRRAIGRRILGARRKA